MDKHTAYTIPLAKEWVQHVYGTLDEVACAPVPPQQAAHFLQTLEEHLLMMRTYLHGVQGLFAEQQQPAIEVEAVQMFHMLQNALDMTEQSLSLLDRVKNI